MLLYGESNWNGEYLEVFVFLNNAAEVVVSDYVHCVLSFGSEVCYRRECLFVQFLLLIFHCFFSASK